MVLYPRNPKHEFNSRTLSCRKPPPDIRSGFNLSVNWSLGIKMDDNLSKWSPLSGRYAKMSGPGIKN